MDLFKALTGFTVGMIIVAGNPAQAGTMGPVHIASWNGFYASGQIGGAWSEARFHYKNPNYFNTLGTELLGNDFHFNASGVIGGGNVGFNYQVEEWLAGVEASFSATDMNAKRNSPFYSTDIYHSKIRSLGSLKGRLGYACDQWMLNVNGGYAATEVGLKLVDPVFGIQAHSSTYWNNGWIAGAGLERKITPKISAGVAYDFAQFQRHNKNMSCSLCGTGIGEGTPTVNRHLRIQSVMARVSYWFNQ